jgi:gamma-butyrobetaine dioxygenase
MNWDPDGLRLEWADGFRVDLPAIWLRDFRPEDRDPSTGQRLVDIADLPEQPRLAFARIQGDALFVGWEEPGTPATRYCFRQVRVAATPRRPRPGPAPRLWDASTAHRLHHGDYEMVLADDASRRAFLYALARDGVAFLHGSPPREGLVLEAARLIGYVRETNYGKLFNVRAVVEPNNLAFTAAALGLHIDNPYRDPVPGLQLLHCVRACAEGGGSVFVDGYAVAAGLRERCPAEFATLTQVPVRFAWSDAGAELEAERPFIRLDRTGAISEVAYNNRSIQPVSLSREETLAFYRAYRAWSLALRDPAFHHRFTLQPGDIVAFDNVRAVHGRDAYNPAMGDRLLQGCYVDRDALYSELAVLNRKLGAMANNED